MPNWCHNRLTVTGSPRDVLTFQQKALGRSPWPECATGEAINPLNFHSLVPIPAEVLASGYSAMGHEWEQVNWGMKWGAMHAQLVDHWEDRLEYEFDTAWVPPLPFLQRLSGQWPGLQFVLEYEESGTGCLGTVKAGGRPQS